MNKKTWTRLTISVIIIIFSKNMLGASGTTAGLILLQPVSARCAGMSESFSAIKNEPGGIYYNPAGVSEISKRNLLLSYQSGFAGDNFGAIIHSQPLDFGVISAGIIYYDLGPVELIDLYGNSKTVIAEQDYIATISFARNIIRNIDIGATIKLLKMNLAESKSASTLAGDLGILYSSKSIKNWSFGLSVQNIGKGLQFIEKEDLLPTNIRTGISFYNELNKNDIRINIDGVYSVNEKETMILTGVEYKLNKNIAFRTGYKFNVTYPQNEAETLSLGIGIEKNSYTIDYAFSLTKDLQIPHRISLGIKY